MSEKRLFLSCLTCCRLFMTESSLSSCLRQKGSTFISATHIRLFGEISSLAFCKNRKYFKWLPTVLKQLSYKVDNLRKDVEKWRTFPLSMMVSINAIKMVSLPTFLYLFQSLPIFLNHWTNFALCLGF